MFTGSRIHSFSWQVVLAQFVPIRPADAAGLASGRFTTLRTGTRFRGTWIQGSKQATLTVVNRVDSKTSSLSILSGQTFEQHLVSSLQFNLPICVDLQRTQHQSNGEVAAPMFQSQRCNLPVLFVAGNRAENVKVQYFAVQFETAAECSQCFELLQEILKGEQEQVPSKVDPTQSLPSSESHTVRLKEAKKEVKRARLRRPLSDALGDLRTLSKTDLHSKLTAFLLDPTFQDYVAEVEAAWKDLENSLAAEIEAASQLC